MTSPPATTDPATTDAPANAAAANPDPGGPGSGVSGFALGDPSSRASSLPAPPVPRSPSASSTRPAPTITVPATVPDASAAVAGDDAPSAESTSPPDVFDTLSPPDRVWLRTRTAAIHRTCRRLISDRLAVGRTLTEVKARVGHGKFVAWVRGYLPWDVRTAQKLMRVAATFADVDADVLNRLDVGAAFYLSQADTPPEALAYALQLAADGDCVTLTQAKEIVAAQRERVVVTGKDVKTLAVPVDREVEKAEEEARARTNAIGAALVTLLTVSEGTDVALHLRADTTEAGDSSYAGTLYPADGSALRHFHGADLLAVLRTLGGDAMLKACAKCKVKKPPNLFAKDSLQRDGLNRYCKACERVRYAAAKQRKREYKAAQNPSES